MKNLKATVAMFVLCGAAAMGCAVSPEGSEPAAADQPARGATVLSEESALFTQVRSEYPDADVFVRRLSGEQIKKPVKTGGCDVESGPATCCVILTFDPATGKGSVETWGDC